MSVPVCPRCESADSRLSARGEPFYFCVQCGHFWYHDEHPETKIKHTPPTRYDYNLDDTNVVKGVYEYIGNPKDRFARIEFDPTCSPTPPQEERLEKQRQTLNQIRQRNIHQIIGRRRPT